MKIKKIAYCGLFTAFIAVMAQISIPMQPIPINLALAAVIVSGMVLGAKYGTLCVAAYILLGCAGIPVFASLRGGIGILTGPTGGYIAGYIIVALISGLVYGKTQKCIFVFLAVLAGVALCYLTGTLWFCVVTGNSFAVGLSACVVPFIPVDIIKITAALFIAKKIKKVA